MPLPALSSHLCSCYPAGSTWQVNGATAPVTLLACPQGDAGSLLEQGWWIEVQCFDTGGWPTAALPPEDFWLVPADPDDVVLCMSFSSSNADSATNAQGMTTMSNTALVAGGCADGMMLVVQGVLLYEADCVTPKLEEIQVRSPDLDGSLIVDLVDLSLFAASYPPMPYETCSDFDVNGVVNLQDLSVFAAHYGPPGHACN